jgi:hypothetical protein
VPFKKFEYHLEAYFHSLKDEPFASFKAVSPFPTFSVGDWIDARAFGTAIDKASTYKVKSVGHVMWEAGDHIGHKLLLLLEANPMVDDTVEWISNITSKPAPVRLRDRPAKSRS